MKKNKLPYQQEPGFKVPPNYFEDLEEALMRKVTQDKAGMDNYKGAPGFVVPEEYLQQLEEQVLLKVEQDQNKEKVISILKLPKLYYAAAVAAILVILLSTGIFNSTVPVFTIDSVELSALEDYIDNGYLDLTFEEISTYITEEGNPIENFNASALSDEEVLNYLNQNVEDPGLLIE